ncbi:MAG: hypothetical protein H6739_20920 [Alphaproteobacteria bacterium]|nr:hypothetical protein [Alphaproteobacteria bacterium]
MQTRSHALEQLLDSLFSPEQLTVFLGRDTVWKRARKHLPPPSVPPEVFMALAVREVERRGRVLELLAALSKEFPGRVEDIEVVEALYAPAGVSPRAAALPQALEPALPAPRPLELPAPAERHHDRCARFLDFVGLLIPVRVANEELGDALEDIHKRLAQGGAVWKVYVRAVSAASWAVVNSVRGPRKPRRNKHGDDEETPPDE